MNQLSDGYEALRSCSSDSQLENTQSLRTSDLISLFKYVLAVAKQIGEEKAWHILESCETEKRIEWLERNTNELETKGTEVEKAYKTFLLKYLNLDPKEVPIVEKTEKRLVYKSYNFCPVLNACKTLSLDTRRICKLVYEEPTQRFLSRLNPKLRFRRNYKKIRPYAGYCEEVIELEE